MSDQDGAGTGGKSDEDEGEDRQFYVKVDRTVKKADGSVNAPLVDYFRLGSKDEDAKFDTKTSVEKEVRKAFSQEDAFGQIEPEIGSDGALLFTSSDRTELIGKNDFKRVVGEAYYAYGEKHEFVDSSNSVSGMGNGVEYSVKRSIEFSAATAVRLEFAGGATYGARQGALIESSGKLKLGFTGSGLVGGQVELAVGKMKAEFNGTGEFTAAGANLNHGETPVYFGEDSITLGLDHDPIHGTIKSALVALTKLINAVDRSYKLNAGIATTRIADFKKDPDKVLSHVTAAEAIAGIQAGIGLIAGVVCVMAGRIQKAKADDLAANIDGKPYFRIDKSAPIGGTNDIKLDTGEGASITLSGDEVTIRAKTINLETNVPTQMGAINVNAGTALDLYGTDSVLISTPQNATVQAVTGIDLNAGAANISSSATRWTHNGAFQAGQTTLGMTTATSLNVNGAPIATAASVAAVEARLQTLPVRIGGLAAAGLIGGVTAAVAGLWS